MMEELTLETEKNKDNKPVFAAIDIGSNAVRLLIKKLEQDGQEPHFSKEMLLRVPLRLGFDVFSTGMISGKKEKDLIRLMKAYKHLMKIYDVSEYRACATSAMRDASNGAEIIKDVEKASGIKIQIIDGQEEARIIYNNHAETVKGQKGNFIYVDVGGGSTEITLLSDGEPVYSRSYNIGTVRILNRSVEDGEWMRLRRDMTDLSETYKNINIIGTGGNINKLYRMLKKNDSNSRISVSSLNAIYGKLLEMDLEERIYTYNLKPDRADVIVPAASIYLTISELIKAAYIYVPVIGLSDGIINELYENWKNTESKTE